MFKRPLSHQLFGRSLQCQLEISLFNTSKLAPLVFRGINVFFGAREKTSYDQILGKAAAARKLGE